MNLRNFISCSLMSFWRYGYLFALEMRLLYRSEIAQIKFQTILSKLSWVTLRLQNFLFIPPFSTNLTLSLSSLFSSAFLFCKAFRRIPTGVGVTNYNIKYYFILNLRFWIIPPVWPFSWLLNFSFHSVPVSWTLERFDPTFVIFYHIIKCFICTVYNFSSELLGVS